MKSSMIVKYNDKDATKELSDECETFSWTDNANGSADTVTMELSNKGQKWMRGYMPQSTDEIKAWIKTEDWMGEKDKKSFCGKFAIDVIKFSGFPERVQISGISVPIGNGFNVRQRYKTWKKTTIKTIMEDISKRAGLKLQFDASDRKIESISQSGKTDLEFAFSLCSEYDLALKLYNGKLIAYDQSRYEKKEAKHTIKRSELGGNEAYSVTKQITKIYNSVKIQYTGKDNKTLTYEFVKPGTKGTRQMFVTTKAESLSDAELKAKAALRKSIRESISVTMHLIGEAKYMAAQNVNLEGFGKLDGKYFIDQVTHSKSGGFTTTLTMHKTVTEF